MTEPANGLGARLGRLVGSNSVFWRLVRFGFVGAISGLVFAISTAFFVNVWLLNPKIASVAGYIVSIPLNFIGNRRFSFRSSNAYLGDIARFTLLHAGNLLLTASSMAVAVDAMGLHYAVGIVSAVVIVPLVNFVAMNWWVFRTRNTPAAPCSLPANLKHPM